MADALAAMNRAHQARERQRAKTKAPIYAAAAICGLIGLGAAAGLWHFGHPVAAVIVAAVGLVAGAGVAAALQLVAEWDRAVVLRLGHFRAVRGPGLFVIVPILDSVQRVVDLRIRTTAFFSESMLTRDTVPVQIDAIAFWSVGSAEKVVLEVESYYQAIAVAVQTALRDVVGLYSLAELLSDREHIARTLERTLETKTQAWGIRVSSIEIRDINIPPNLEEALSKQAQAERERQSRTILGQAETEIAEKFVAAAESYQNNPVALQLRAMNILYEGLRTGNSLMLVPSSTLDAMNLGGLVSLGAEQLGKGQPKGPDAGAAGGEASTE